MSESGLAKKQQRIKQKVKNLIHSEHLNVSVMIASALESTVIPIPLEAILIPLMQAKRKQIWLIACFATLGCLLGALVGYLVGYYLFSLIGDWLIHTFSNPEQFSLVKESMQTEGFWFVLTVGIVPIPFQIAMLAAGATQYSILMFMLATIIARGVRYFGLACLVYYAGNKAELLLRKYKMKAILLVISIVFAIWFVISSWW